MSPNVGGAESTGVITERRFLSPGGIEDKVAVRFTGMTSLLLTTKDMF